MVQESYRNPHYSGLKKVSLFNLSTDAEWHINQRTVHRSSESSWTDTFSTNSLNRSLSLTWQRVVVKLQRYELFFPSIARCHRPLRPSCAGSLGLESSTLALFEAATSRCAPRSQHSCSSQTSGRSTCSSPVPLQGSPTSVDELVFALRLAGTSFRYRRCGSFHSSGLRGKDKLAVFGALLQRCGERQASSTNVSLATRRNRPYRVRLSGNV